MNIHKISKFFAFFTLTLFFSANFALAANTFNTNLSWNMGSKGTNDVKKLQEFLKSQGLYSGPVTGVFLNQTYKSVVSFQKKYGLDPTGYFGPMTRNVANKLSQNNSITTNASSTTVLDNNSTITLSNSDLQARISSLYEQVWILQRKLRDNQNSSRGGQQSNNQTPQTSGGTSQTSVTPTPPPTPLPLPPPTPSPLPANNSTSTNSSNNQTPNIDRVVPTVLITSPGSGSVVSGTTVVISATASDNILVSGVQFKIDNINFGTEDISMPYSVTWNSKSVSNGLHSITAVARDSSGNMATTTMSVNVSNQTVVQTPPPAPTPTPTPTPLPVPPPSPTPTPVTPQASTTVVYPLEITSDGLVTNEYAFFSPTDKKSFFSKYWEMTSGSLYVKNSQYWTGLPDLVEPNYNSSNGTGSSVFRLTTKDSSFQNASVAFNFTLNNLVSDVIDSDTGKAPAWDGAHIFLRYQNETNLYYASFTRRDGTVILKKKCTGGPDNGGTYYELSPSVKSTLNSGSNLIRADIKNVGSSAKIDLYINGNLIVSSTDNGLGCSVISNPGKVGIRGDDANFYFSNFTVQKL